jgi:hypothetical protein
MLMEQRKHDENGFKLKFTKNRIIFILALSVIVFIALYYYFFVPKPITSVQYGNYILNFRSDLREASKVPVYPSEDALYLEMMHGLVQNVTIAFKPTNDGDAIYSVEAFEITYKLRLGYMIRNFNPGFNSMNVSSYENLPGKIQNPIIALVHPVYSNETSIRVEGHVVTIKGKTLEDFDLAVDKFLMVTLGIEV